MRERITEALLEPWLRFVARNHVTKHPPVQAPSAIAIVSTTALGDTLLSTPLVVSARTSFPKSRIAFVVHPRLLPLFQGLESADTVLSFDGSTIGLFKAVTELRRFRPEAVILAHSNAPQDIPLGVLSGASTVLKPMTRSRLARYLSAMLSPCQRHIIEQRLDLLRWLGATQITTRMAVPNRYAQLPLSNRTSKIRIGFQLGAANCYKIWPVERFAELACRLLTSNKDVSIVLTGVSAEKNLARRFLQGVQDHTHRIEDRVGKTIIATLPSLLRSLDVLVTNDTGTLHLAVALGVPTISLFGATSPDLIGPYQDLERHTVIAKQGPSQAHLPKRARTDANMRLITVDEVEDAVVAHLSKLHP